MEKSVGPNRFSQILGWRLKSLFNFDCSVISILSSSLLKIIKQNNQNVKKLDYQKESTLNF